MALTSPARAQFARLTATGLVPTIGQPGSLVFNIPDRKAWTFDGAGVPVLLTTGIYPHDPALSYATGDLVLQNDALYRANTAVSPGAFNPAQWTAVLPDTDTVPSEPAGSGVVSGGLMTITSATQVSVAAGTGVIVVSQNPAAVTSAAVSWGAQTITVSPGGATEMVIAIDAAGTVAAYPLSDIDVARRTLVFIGVTVHNDAGQIVSICATSKVTARAADLLNDFLRAVGGPFKIDGCDVAANGATLTLAAETGTAFYPGVGWRAGSPNPNFVTFPALTPITFDTIKADGEVVATGTALNPAIYESGAVPSGFAVIHYLFAKPNGSRFALQLGQTLYTSLAAAQTAVGEDWESFDSAYSPDIHIMLLAAVIVMSGATSLADPAQARIVNVLSGPRRGVVFRYPYVAGEEYLPRDGSAAMTGALDMGGNAILNAVIDEGTF